MGGHFQHDGFLIVLDYISNPSWASWVTARLTYQSHDTALDFALSYNAVFLESSRVIAFCEG